MLCQAFCKTFASSIICRRKAELAGKDFRRHDEWYETYLGESIVDISVVVNEIDDFGIIGVCLARQLAELPIERLHRDDCMVSRRTKKCKYKSGRVVGWDGMGWNGWIRIYIIM